MWVCNLLTFQNLFSGKCLTWSCLLGSGGIIILDEGVTFALYDTPAPVKIASYFLPIFIRSHLIVFAYAVCLCLANSIMIFETVPCHALNNFALKLLNRSQLHSYYNVHAIIASPWKYTIVEQSRPQNLISDTLTFARKLAQNGSVYPTWITLLSPEQQWKKTKCFHKRGCGFGTPVYIYIGGTFSK